MTGGNLDNKRIGKGMTMFYPVEVEGALISMGDAHTGKYNTPTASISYLIGVLF